MQGPWVYDDSMGGHSILAADAGGASCGSCGRGPHEEDCPPAAGDRRV